MAEFTSKVTIARPDSPSLRTTIPEGVAKMMELEASDELVWRVNVKSGKVEITISKG